MNQLPFTAAFLNNSGTFYNVNNGIVLHADDYQIYLYDKPSFVFKSATRDQVNLQLEMLNSAYQAGYKDCIMKIELDGAIKTAYDLGANSSANS